MSTIRVSAWFAVVACLCACVHAQGVAASSAASGAPATAVATAPAATLSAVDLPADAIKKFGVVDADGGRLGKVNALAISADGGTIVAVCEDGRIHVWDFASGKCRTMTYAEGPALVPAPAPATATSPASAPADSRRLESVALSADGKLVAAGGQDGVHVWQLADSKYVCKLAAEAPVGKVSFSRDGKRIKALIGEELLTWNIVDKTVISKDKAHKPPHYPNGSAPGWTVRLLGSVDDVMDEYCASLWSIEADRDNAYGIHLCVCETGSDAVLFEMTIQQFGAAVRGVLAVSPDGRFAAFSTSRDGGVLTVASVGIATYRATYKASLSPVTAVSFSRDGKMVISGDEEGGIYVWPVKRKRLTQRDFGVVWKALANESKQAFASFMELVDGGDEVVPAIISHARPKVQTDMTEFKKLVADLDSDTYSVRSRAHDKLEAKAQAIWPVLQDAQSKASSTEVRNALEVLLSKVEKGNPVQEKYAVRVLERIDTELARESLRWLARAPEESNLGKLARAAVAKLATGPTTRP